MRAAARLIYQQPPFFLGSSSSSPSHPLFKFSSYPSVYSSRTQSRSLFPIPPEMPGTPSTDIASFQEALSSSTRILSLLGAGLSASSGLPTFRGAGGFWRNHDATVLATPQAFRRDPGLVWQFYAYRRHMALNAQPNAAHYALAELARKKEGFVTLSQNVDGTLCCQLFIFSVNQPSTYIHRMQRPASSRESLSLPAVL